MGWLLASPGGISLARISRDIISLGFASIHGNSPNTILGFQTLFGASLPCERAFILRNVLMKFSKDDHRFVTGLGMPPPDFCPI